MKSDQKKIENLVERETQKVKKKRPVLEELEFTYEQKTKGTFLARVKARTKKKTILLIEENRCPETSVRKAFSNLMRVLNKKRFNRRRKTSFRLLGEAA